MSRSRTTRRPRVYRRPPGGQHFLVNPRVRQQILARLNSRPGDCWLEIGAGHGEMTLPLAGTGARVAAVERDPRLAEGLQAQIVGFPQVEVVVGDILEISPAELGRKLGCSHWRVYGNLPYYITSPILRHLFGALDAILDIHVVVQREVAERLVARPGGRDYGYLSVLTQFHTTPEMLQRIPRGAFRPPPQVESALVRLTPPGQRVRLGVEEVEGFLRFVQMCFRQKRRTLVNNLRGLAERIDIEQALTEAGHDTRVRAEQLGLGDFARLYRALSPARRGAG